MVIKRIHGFSHKNQIRKTREDYIVDFFVYLICLVIFVLTFYPFYLSVVLAFNQSSDSLLGGIYFRPRAFTMGSFLQILHNPELGRALRVTIARTVAGTCITVSCTTALAYGLSQRNLVGRKFYMMLLIIALFCTGGVIPYYVVLRALKILNTFWVYILPGAVNIFYVLISINFFYSIPNEIKESAQIDGASELRTYLAIILPISKPLLATLTIFISVGQWNEWNDSVFYMMGNEKLHTLAHLLKVILNQNSSLTMQLSAMIVSAGPILLVYPFFQKYFVQGLTLGAVKG